MALFYHSFTVFAEEVSDHTLLVVFAFVVLDTLAFAGVVEGWL